MGWARFELPRENHNAGLVHFVSSRLFELKLSLVELRPMGGNCDGTRTTRYLTKKAWEPQCGGAI